MSGEVGPGEAQEPSSRTLCHGRFAEGPADALLAFTASLDVDRRLADTDDGTITGLIVKYLGGDPSSVPFIEIPGA